MDQIHHRPSSSWWAREDVVGGCVIVAIAAFAYVQAMPLSSGTLGQIGPGLLPRALSILLAALGLTLLVLAVLGRGPQLERFSLRGPLFLLAAVVLFGLTIRPLGLVVAGPVAIVVGALASNEVRWGETLAVALLMTAFCTGLFKFVLGLPIPLAPWWIGY
jgi:putative tricarboxylic transport membrane protein